MKKTVRVSVPVSLELLGRLEQLVSNTPGPKPPSKSDLLAEAIERGIALMEVDSRARHTEAAARRVAVEAGHLAPDEAHNVVRREGRIAFGSRTGVDRRTGPRPEQGGRRDADNRQARQVFLQKVMQLANEGKSYKEIAEALNAEGITTSRGQPWSTSAVAQVVRTEREKRERQAWTPKALK